VPALELYRCRPARGGYEAVPLWRPSTTGRPLEKRHLNLKIVPAGIRDFGADQGYTPIDLVMAACDCDLDTAFKFLTERLGFGVEIDVSGLVATQEPAQVAEPELKSDGQGCAQTSAGPKPAPAEDKLVSFTHPPGLVGDIIDWVTATAFEPNRVLALSVAITVVGTLIGRRVAGPTRSATHLYCVSIAPSGSGKQHPMNAARRLMQAAGAESHVTGPTRFFSLSAVERQLTTRPLSLCLLDEIGAFLRRVTSGKASSHELGISEIFRTVWGVSFNTIETTRRANEDGCIIRSPALSILGMSTPDEFLDALQGESVANGFLNRFLMLSAGVEDVAGIVDVEPQADPGTVPSGLAGGLNRLYLWSGPESLLSIADPGADFAPEVLPWASNAAHECYLDLKNVVRRHMADNSETADYLRRCAETAIRLATIRAVGRWGRGASIAWTATHATATKMLDFLPGNERSQTIAKLASWVRRKHGERGRPITRKEVQTFLGGRVKAADFRDMFEHLVLAGTIKPDGNGFVPG
jgi:hypothetical protein